MLFLLTGDVQIGKTRWLQKALDVLAADGVAACGVTAPGRWRETTGPNGEVVYEKLGIDNVLFPGGRRVAFATRRDLLETGAYDASCTQAGQLQLGWAISDEAISEVNDHFVALVRQAMPGKGLLVIDELGRLEIERGIGLTEALALLEAGPSPAWQHALVVARIDLAPLVEERYARAWGGCTRLRPDDTSVEPLLTAFGAPVTPMLYQNMHS